MAGTGKFRWAGAMGLVLCCAAGPAPLAAQFDPPPCDGAAPFLDVATTHPYCEWIQQLKADEITAGDGCGGGRYCPDNPVTRAQLAMLLERAVRGTETFKLQQAYAKVATVALLGTGDYSSPNKAMEDLAGWCGSPGVENRCLIRVQPGIYTVPSTLILPDYVDLEGSGMEMTRLDFAGTDDVDTPAVLAEGEGEIRDLEIRASGADYPLGLFMKESSSRTLRRVRVNALFGGVATIAVRVTNGASPEIVDSELFAGGTVSVTALDVSGGTFSSQPRVRRSVISVGGPGSACAGVAVLGNVSTTHIVELSDNRIMALGCASGTGVDAGVNSRVSVQGGSIVAATSTIENVGLKTATISAFHLLTNVDVNAGGPGGTALVVGGGTGYVEIRGSKITGSNNSMSAADGGVYAFDSQFFGPLTSDAASVTYIATSQINDSVGGAGTYKCIGAFDTAFDPLGASCL